MKEGGLFTDNAIESTRDDRLGRAPFVDALGREIMRVPQGQSMVLALCGPWGSGKTSILNLVAEKLSSDPGVAVLRFNPWLFSGVEQLVGNFFRDVAAQLVSSKDSRLKSVAEALDSYGALLDPLGGLPFAGTAIRTGTGIARGVARIFRQRSKVPAGSAERQRQQTIELLKAAGRRVVVLVDDVDRLRQEEILEVMRLVRLVGDFPNVVYLLAFDRQRVVGALANVERDGQAYLEKIVQAAFDVPSTAETDLAALLISVVNPYLDRHPAPTQQDVNNIFFKVIRPLFATAREVRRYANCLPMVFDLCGTEVASLDLLALEAIRVSCPTVFERLESASDFLTAVTEAGNSRDGVADRKLLEDVLDAAGSHRDAVRNFLADVFPPTRLFIDNHIFGYEARERWLRDRRVAHPDVLRIFFEKRVPEGALPQTRVLNIVTSTADPKEFRTLLEAFSSTELENLLQRLALYVDRVAPSDIESTIVVLGSLRDRIREGRAGPYDMDNAERALRRVLLKLLMRVGEGPARLDALARLVPRLPNLSAKYQLISLAAQKEIGTEEDQKRLGAALAVEVAGTSPDGLAAERDLLELAMLARQHGVLSPARVDALVQDDSAMTRLLRSSINEGFKWQMGDVSAAKQVRLHWKVLQDIVGPERLVERVKALASRPNVAVDDRDRLALETAQRHANGLPADPRDDDDG